MMRKSSAPPCYLHMTSSEASVTQNKIGKKKDRLSKSPRVLHLKAELQDRDTFQRTILGKGHMYAYKIIPESSAFVPQLSPNGAIVLPGSWHPDFSHAAAGPGRGAPAEPARPGAARDLPGTFPAPRICRSRSGASAERSFHTELLTWREKTRWYGRSICIPLLPCVFSRLAKVVLNKYHYKQSQLMM